MAIPLTLSFVRGLMGGERLSILALLAAAALVGQVSVHAAEPASAGAGELEEIVVTAEKRESTVQKTPISMTALSAAQLVEQGLKSIEDVAVETPGISMKQFSPGQTEYEMRGLSSGGGSSATVGLYLNDVPMTAPAGSVNGKALIDPDLYDLQRVEVLRGPQGTLYGAGSMGGTIKLITAPPEFNKFEGSSQSIVSDTTHGGINWGESAMLNLPLVDDRLALRLVGTHQYSDGWIDRIVVSPFPVGPGGTCGWATCARGNVLAAPVVKNLPKSNWDNLDGGRGSVRFQPTDALSFDLMVMYQARTTGAFSQVDQEIGLDTLAHYEPFNIESPFRDTFRIASLSINYDMGFAQLTSATGAWSHESVWPGDYSESGQNLTNTYYGDPNFVPVSYRNSDRSKQTSQELRLTSEGDTRFQWLVGAFFSDFESISDQNVQSPDYAPLSTGGAAANPEGILFRGYEPYHIKQYALFAETSYHITDELKATVGVRGFRFDNRLDYELTGIFALSGNGTPSYGDVSSSNSGVNPKFNLSYEPNQNLTVYGQIAKGFRPGGLNIPAPVPPCATAIQPSYGPDSIWNYEVGEKARLMDGRLTINADVFYIHWNNVQQSLVLACSYPFTGNIGKWRVLWTRVRGGRQGIEGLHVFCWRFVHAGAHHLGAAGISGEYRRIHRGPRPGHTCSECAPLQRRGCAEL
jgi:iron complex outermembrane receptor protein